MSGIDIAIDVIVIVGANIVINCAFGRRTNNFANKNMKIDQMFQIGMITTSCSLGKAQQQKIKAWKIRTIKYIETAYQLTNQATNHGRSH